MSKTTQSINVTIPHKLSVEEAAERLSRADKPSILAVLSSMVATAKLRKVTAEIDVDVPGSDILLTVVIASERVMVESGPVSRITELIAESAIESKLTELLK